MELYEDAVEELAPLYDNLKDNFRFIYDYGYALHKCKRYQDSNQILKEGAKISSDPMFYNIIGRNYEAMKEYDKARDAYIHAHNMVPCRIYPLVLLMEMYASIGDEKTAMKYGASALQTPYNERHRNMLLLRNRVQECCDTLNVGI